MVDFRIRVVVDPSQAQRGAAQTQRALDGVSDRAERTRRLLARAFVLVGAGALISQLGTLADTYTNVQNRLRIVTNGTAELSEVTDELFRISNRTRSSFQSTAELYARVGLSARELGVSQRQLLEFTESLNQAVILSGATAQEASAGIIQLAQGMASGALRGDELRSVLEQLPAVADVIARSMGVTRGELRELGTQGRITADIILAAFSEARQELADNFARTVPTIGQSFEVLRNSLIQFVGDFDSFAGASSGLSSAILLLAENMERVAQVATALGVILVAHLVNRGIALAGVALGNLGGNIVAVTQRFARMRGSSVAAAAGLVTLNRAARLTRVAFGALGGPTGVILLAAFGLFEFARANREAREEINDTNDSVRKFIRSIETQNRAQFDAQLIRLDREIRRRRRAIESDERILSRLQTRTPTIDANLVFGLRQEDEAQSRAIREQTTLLQGRISTRQEELALLQQQRTAAVELQRFSVDDSRQQAPDILVLRNQVELTTRQVTQLRRLRATLEPLAEAQRRLEEGTQLLTLAQNTGNISLRQRDFLLRRLAESLRDQLDPLGAVTRGLEQEARLLGMTARAREVESRFLEIQMRLKSQGVVLTDAETDALRRQIRAIQDLGRVRQADDPEAVGFSLSDEQVNALQRLRDQLNPVAAASRQVAEAQTLLDNAVGATAISTEEATRLLADYRFALRDQLDPLGAVNRALGQEAELLRLSRQEYRLQSQVIQIVNALRAQGVVLSDRERRDLEIRLRRLQVSREERRVLDQVRGASERYAQVQVTLRRLVNDSRISTDEYNDALDRARLTFLETQRDFRSGARRALLRIQLQAMDAASAIDSAITGAFRNMRDALVDFVTTGKLEIGDLVQSIIADFARIAVQRNITGPLVNALSGSLGGLFGGGGSGLGFNVLGFQRGGFTGSTGGIVHPREFVVNERGTRNNRELLELLNRGAQVPAVVQSSSAGTNVVVNDFRTSSEAEPVEVEESRGADGNDVIRITVRDSVRDGIRNGDFDGPMAGRYGVRPALGGR